MYETSSKSDASAPVGPEMIATLKILIQAYLWLL